MIYIVTNSEHYYPDSGAHDWEFVTRDREAAEARARGIAEDVDLHWHSVYIITINEDNLHVTHREIRQ